MHARTHLSTQVISCSAWRRADFVAPPFCHPHEIHRNKRRGQDTCQSPRNEMIRNNQANNWCFFRELTSNWSSRQGVWYLIWCLKSWLFSGGCQARPRRELLLLLQSSASSPGPAVRWAFTAARGKAQFSSCRGAYALRHTPVLGVQHPHSPSPATGSEQAKAFPG